MLRSQPYKLLHDSDASDSSSSSSSPTGSFSTPTCCSTSPTGSTSSPIVFCIHGNKWGVATCCQDIDQDSAEHEPMVSSCLILVCCFFVENITYNELYFSWVTKAWLRGASAKESRPTTAISQRMGKGWIKGIILSKMCFVVTLYQS